MRPGREPIHAWINGVKAPFDRVSVRLSHAADEVHYVGGLEIQSGAPEGDVDGHPGYWAGPPVRDHYDSDWVLSLR